MPLEEVTFILSWRKWEFGLASPPEISISFNRWFTNVWVLSGNTDISTSKGFWPWDLALPTGRSYSEAVFLKCHIKKFIYIYSGVFFSFPQKTDNLSCTRNGWFWCNLVCPLQHPWRGSQQGYLCPETSLHSKESRRERESLEEIPMVRVEERRPQVSNNFHQHSLKTDTVLIW